MLKLRVQPKEMIQVGEDIYIGFDHSTQNYIYLVVDAPKEKKVLRIENQGRKEFDELISENRIQNN